MNKRELIEKLDRFKDEDEIRVVSGDRLYDYKVLYIMDREFYTDRRGNTGALLFLSLDGHEL